MGHLNAALEWLVQVFNDMWPIVLATFIGAWLAFQYLKHYEKEKSKSERFSISQYISFVLKSQAERLFTLRAQHLDPHREHARRANMVDAVVIHDDFPRLDMTKLPVVFEQSNVTLMNDVIECEYGFLEVTRLLRRRERELQYIEKLTEPGEDAKQKRAASRRRLVATTDRLFELADKLYDVYPFVVERIDTFVKSQENEKHIDLVDYVAWMILSGVCATVGVFFFSHWAANVGSTTNFGLDISLVSALVFAISLYASLAMCLIVAVMALYALVQRLQTFPIYFWCFLISLLPAMFLFWLDAG
ncbi:MAG: hypothetical protein OEX00_05745 [Gammaproteobacteria bacterium]|nr:hypothetical protein [Gammaproteobacteria bacterium]MDH5692700.1 hypothetical protein [Gammaproteobacteria bacterium]